MRGNHDYIFGFLKSVCYAFGHLYGKQEGISTEVLMEELSLIHICSAERLHHVPVYSPTRPHKAE